MSSESGRSPKFNARDHDLPCDELFIKMYRCAMAALSFGDTGSWDLGRRLLARHVPADDVGPLFGQFYGFARTAIAASRTPLSCRPLSHPEVSAEEALALRMIEASQRSDQVGTLAAATMLLGDDDLGGVFQSTQSLARALARCGLFVDAAPRTAEPATTPVMSETDRFKAGRSPLSDAACPRAARREAGDRRRPGAV